MNEARRPPVKGDHTRYDVNLRHIPCGSRVTRNYDDSYSCCSGSCKVKWKSEIISKFMDAEMAERFYVSVPADLDTYVLISRIDEFTKRSHTILVKRSELRETDTKIKL